MVCSSVRNVGFGISCVSISLGIPTFLSSPHSDCWNSPALFLNPPDLRWEDLYLRMWATLLVSSLCHHTHPGFRGQYRQ